MASKHRMFSKVIFRLWFYLCSVKCQGAEQKLLALSETSMFGVDVLVLLHTVFALHQTLPSKSP